MKQDVVILTRSSKYRNFCVAGVDKYRRMGKIGF